ncbi:MAG: hypothetical protein HYW56_01605 [Candidatus Harrisonbacteria bacterium]|nr:hypothetical protein [Candidatus Harrisonbacteria bacterium]
MVSTKVRNGTKIRKDNDGEKLKIKYMRKATKKVNKKITRKAVKRVVKKFAAKKAAPKKQKPVGVVTHYYGGIGVGIIKCAAPLTLHARVQFKGATTDFTQLLDSMEYDRKPIAAAKKGQEVGVKVNDRVREGDEVYLLKS